MSRWALANGRKLTPPTPQNIVLKPLVTMSSWIDESLATRGCLTEAENSTSGTRHSSLPRVAQHSPGRPERDLLLFERQITGFQIRRRHAGGCRRFGRVATGRVRARRTWHNGHLSQSRFEFGDGSR